MSRKTRKLMWSVPLIAAVAVIGALAAFMTLGTGNLFASDFTSQPMNLKVSPADGSMGRTALVLTWDAPEGGETPTGYRIDVSNNNKSYKFLAMTDADTRTYTHSGLPGSTDGTTRFYRVFAMNEHGAGKVSTWEEGTTKKVTVPGQVKPFDWTSTDPTQIVLNWTAPDDGGADIMGYCIRAWPTDTTTAEADRTAISTTNCTNSFATEGPGGSGGAYPDGPGGIIRILPAETYTHKGLKAKQKWSYEIYAVNEHGYSEKVSATRNATAAAAGTPTPPGSLLALQNTVTNTDRVINLYWTAPDPKGQNITGYEIEVSDRRNHWPSPGTTRPAAAARLTTKTPTGADAANGLLAPESTITAGTVNNDPAVAIIAINATSQTADEPFQLQHTYTGTDRDGAGGNDAVFASTLYYRVRTITNNDAGDSEMKSTSYVSTSVAVTEPDGTDGFTAPILAPLVGADAASTIATPNQDTNGSDAADNDRTPAELRLHTSHQTDGASSYRVDISTNNGATWTTHEAASRPISHYDFRGPDVKPGELYRFRLFSKKGNLGLASIVVQDYAGYSRAPGAVRNLTATADGAGMIDLSWNAPSSNGGATIDTYCIVASDDGASAAPLRSTIVVVDDDTTPELESNCTRFGAPDKSPITIGNGVSQVEGTTTSVSFKGVMAETQWFFRVYGLNGATGPTAATGDPPTTADLSIGLAASSERNDATTGSAVVPGAPPYLTAEDARDTNFQGVGKQGVLVLWTAPANPAGAPVLGYKVEVSTDNGTTYTTLVDNLNTGETHFVQGSPERPTDETRMYRVTSINSVDLGTEVATVTLPLGEHSHKPGVPQSVSATADADNATTIKVTWMAAEDNGSAVTGYMLQSQYMMADGSKSEWMNVVPVFPPDQITGMMYEHTRLMPNTTYYYRVRATNANGYGEYSDGMASAMTGDVVPNAPMSVTAAVDDTVITKINVSWGTPADNGGSEVTGYMVQRGTMSSDGTMSWTDVSLHTGTDMTYMDTGLTPNTKYYYRVAAVNAAGTGEYSDGAANAMTGSADLMMPTKVEASTTGAGELTLSWEGGQNADFFLLLAVDMNSVAAGNVTYDRARVNDPAARTGMVTGLDSGTQYLGIVIAIKGTGADTKVMYETAGLVTVQ